MNHLLRTLYVIIMQSIPTCTHGHFFEHVQSTALLYHSGSTPWEVAIQKMQFTIGIRNFLVENNIHIGYELLLCHFGLFHFEVIWFNANGDRVVNVHPVVGDGVHRLAPNSK